MTCSRLDVNDKLTKSHQADWFTSGAAEIAFGEGSLPVRHSLHADYGLPMIWRRRILAIRGPPVPKCSEPCIARRVISWDTFAAREERAPSRRGRILAILLFADPYFFSGPGVAAAINVLLNSASKSSDRFA